MSTGDPINTSITAATYNYIGGGGSNLDLSTDKDFQELKMKIMCMETQLMILNPEHELHKKYPALKEAYDAYQVILKLVKDNADKTKKHE